MEKMKVLSPKNLSITPKHEGNVGSHWCFYIPQPGLVRKKNQTSGNIQLRQGEPTPSSSREEFNLHAPETGGRTNP